jgi:cyanophycin synthetase
VLELALASPAACARWRARVAAMAARLGWPAPRFGEHRDGDAASLAFTAPRDQLLAATEVGEWAWQAQAVEAAAGRDGLLPPLFLSPAHADARDVDAAFGTLSRLAGAEARSRAMALRAAAQARGLSCLADDEVLSLGLGSGSRCWPIDALPDDAGVPWGALHEVPVALVTGSNGKTTTVRLLAACWRAAGRRAGFNCTDGVFVDGEAIERGDWSGPAGARAVLRDPRVDAAVLEAARGGLMRRGLALDRADAAIVTNVSADHFGEYGIRDLDGLADAKLVVARALGPDGWLVLNADDAVLVRHAAAAGRRVAWFGLDADARVLRDAIAAGSPACAFDGGALQLWLDGARHALGAVDEFPIAVGGAARYNLANLAGAALLAAVQGIPVDAIRRALAAFGAERSDNPGRLQRWRIDGADVLVDYAHNPAGLRGLLAVAEGLRAPGGALRLLLGQAGNRDDAAIAELAAVAAASRPVQVMLKDIAGYLRGRGEGAVADVLGDALRAHGVPADAITVELDESEAARRLVEAAAPGDVVVLPVHNLDARDRLAAWLDAR